jgi:hypothetical protein
LIFIGLQQFGRFLTASQDATDMTPSTAALLSTARPFGRPPASRSGLSPALFARHFDGDFARSGWASNVVQSAGYCHKYLNNQHVIQKRRGWPPFCLPLAPSGRAGIRSRRQQADSNRRLTARNTSFLFREDRHTILLIIPIIYKLAKPYFKNKQKKCHNNKSSYKFGAASIQKHIIDNLKTVIV